MKGGWLIIFIVLLCVFVLFIIMLLGGFREVTYSVENIPQHNYTEKEYIHLYNFCIRKRNAKCNERISMIRNEQINNMDKIIDFCYQEYNQSYYNIDYNILCKKLLSLLTQEEQKHINYGIIEEETKYGK